MHESTYFLPGEKSGCSIKNKTIKNLNPTNKIESRQQDWQNNVEEKDTYGPLTFTQFLIEPPVKAFFPIESSFNHRLPN
jgi:hypothetical protein